MATTATLSRLGKYELVRPLGKGGMAAVYLARTGHGRFTREVALKVLEHDASHENTEMFLTEARVLGMLQHPNIASVIDVDIDDGTLYLAMEHVDGVDLRELLVACFERKELPSYEVALAIIAQAAAGLDHAHRRCDTKGRPLRIVHRDVSLTNIMVTHDGGVKVVDFGIARSTLSTAHTMPGTVRGKPSYMAPEQCTGDPVDHRTDVFALGIVLYELTTGMRCFEGESDFDRMLAVVRGTFQRPSAVQHDFPDDLEQVIMKALARDPADRYASCAAMVAALEQILRERGWAGGSSAIRRAMQVVFGGARDAAIKATIEMPIAVTAPTECVQLSEPIPHRRFARGSRVELSLDDDITAGRRSIKRIANVLSDDRTFQGSNS
ncbi:MAG: serine/threonine protein kinase [Deltaproteobacteria bacterium]|nr:serine/threonine protein kinase [Deltaproteobacteria bacterium]